MYKIGTLNKISPVGLARLTDDYTVVEDVAEANGIILRSYEHARDGAFRRICWLSAEPAQA